MTDSVSPSEDVGAGRSGGEGESRPSHRAPPWRGPRPSAGAAWLLIVLAVAVMVLASQRQRGAAAASDPLRSDPITELRAKLLYGGASIAGGEPDARLDQALEEMMVDASEAPGLAWRVASVRAALERDARVAREILVPLVEAHDDQVAAMGGEAARVHEAVKQALHDPAALEPAQARRLEERLGWFGRALISHRSGSRDARRVGVESEARRALWASLGALALAAVGLLGGIVLLTFITAKAASGASGFGLPEVRAPRAVFLEACAVYLWLNLTLAVAGGWLGGASRPLAVGVPLMAVAALGGVAWPFLRGKDASAVAADLGLTRGRGVIVEVGAGLVGYVACLPLLALGVLGTLGVAGVYMELARRFGWEMGAAGSPHPAIDWVAGGSALTRAGVLLLATGFAPFFEEVMFRGALLRGAAASGRSAAAILIMAFIFAAIHPQGWIAVPALMSLAIGLALMRMWRRGCLIAPMAAHALHNGTIMLILFLLLD